MPSVWNHDADKHLLLSIIDCGTAWPQIAERMLTKGFNFSDQACRQHFQKIRREANSASGTPNGSTPRTPKRPRTNGTPKSTPSKLAKGNGKDSSFSSAKSARYGGSLNYNAEDNDEDDDEEDEYLNTGGVKIKQQDGEGINGVKMEDVSEKYGFGAYGMGNGMNGVNGGNGLQNMRQFKVEDRSGGGRSGGKEVIDLENDDIYDDDA